MNQPRVVGMTINHRELDHLLTSISDVIRNAAYKVAKPEDFDESGTLIVMEESAVKALLQDALDHYIQFTAGTIINPNNQHLSFNYYLDDSFQMVADYIKQDPTVFSYVSALFAQACGVLSSAIAPAIEDVCSSGQSIEKIDSFTIGSDNSYYVIHGESDDDPNPADEPEPLNNLCAEVPLPVVEMSL